MNRIHRRRQIVNRFAMFMAMATMLFGLFWLGWILWTLFYEGFGALSVRLFTSMTPPPGAEGGLLNAIVGSALMASIGTLIGTPVGIFAGIYLSEYGNKGWLAPVTRFINDILL